MQAHPFGDDVIRTPCRRRPADASLLPPRRGRWNARAGLEAVAVTLAVAALVALTDPDLGGVASGLWLGSFVSIAVTASRSQRLLLRLAVVSRADPAAAARAIEELICEARAPRIRAALVAALAELELYAGDARRGHRLFAGLRARGWTPSALVTGCAGAHALVVDAAATMAALERRAGSGAGAETLLRSCRRFADRPSVALLAGLLHARCGRDADARRALARVRPVPDDHRARCAALRLLRALYEIPPADAPYRRATLPAPDPALWRRLEWLFDGVGPAPGRSSNASPPPR